MTLNNKYITKIIAASLLGDGHVGNPEINNCRFSLSQREDHKDYLEWFASKLESFVGVTINYPSESAKNIKEIPFLSRTIESQPQLRLRTKCHPFFNKFRERMYGTGRKSVDLHYLTLLDSEFLAIWFQEDGSFSVDYRSKNPQPKIYLSTLGFSEPENILLRKALKEKLDLEWTLNREINRLGNVQYKLHLSNKSSRRFFDLITPFVVPSYYYKVNVERLTPDYNNQDDDIVQTSQECEEIGRNDQSLE